MKASTWAILLGIALLTVAYVAQKGVVAPDSLPVALPGIPISTINISTPGWLANSGVATPVIPISLTSDTVAVITSGD